MLDGEKLFILGCKLDILKDSCSRKSGNLEAGRKSHWPYNFTSREMRGRWNLFRFLLQKVIWVVLIFHLKIDQCWSLNLEGLALLDFCSKVETDPFGALSNWNPADNDPCAWSGVHCLDGSVKKLELKGLSLGGTLSSELGKLNQLTTLVLSKNHFFGAIPMEIGELTKLEILDLSDNCLSGWIPKEVGNISPLKMLRLSHNRFQGGLPQEIGKLKLLSVLLVDQNLASGASPETFAWSRKLGLRGGSIYNDEKSDGNLSAGSAVPYLTQGIKLVVESVRRKLLQESSNLPAVPIGGVPEPTSVPSTGSGSFPAVPSNSETSGVSPVHSPSPSPSPANVPSSDPLAKNPSSPKSPVFAEKPSNSSDNHSTSSTKNSSKMWVYVVVLPVVSVIAIACVAILCVCRNRGASTIGPWKTGLSGQLQKAFVTGVPELNRSELEAACEDFSNIIGSLPDCTVFKGTLSSGVEIAVASTTVPSAKEWSNRAEIHFRKKIDTLSRLNHKNYVNLIGYCEEDDPFVRMMVFEYAPNGTLYEHLHVKEVEHLDWTARVRIIMGMAYCLQYMHHELNPPVAHPNLNSNAIYLTDDFAAKLADFSFWKDFVSRGKSTGDDDSDNSDFPFADPDSNVYSFGILLLEIISGKLPYSKEQGLLVNLAIDYMNDKRSISYMIDPTLKSFKNKELDVICEVIQECIQPDIKQRPTIKEITAKLREAIPISPDAATPRLSPLWWAELEILSVEAS
ncbi:protein MALE DISCOVERER 1 isoform X2 [Amborella trichopoda]|uniref:Protein kinase domain-containing protein n=1 Tax=Amborella trichopoda TaxID=13333 RepID=W1NQH3_AMBTC|nr:protein MALE DISCOVERER 1 isoform X2 [Amborella trichopoda]ERM97683.1 hypothetical protein AMTR_s00130p00117400 [Amborella trichopoda]|eukprot:XP_020517783.1 protein MALE DISCOVERER 1 isoform X2 [Amborella trichopoda]